MPIYQTGRKKDGRQQYRVRINYTDAAGEYHQKEQLCLGYREAQELETRLRNMYAADGDRGAILLRDFFDEYMRLRAGQIRETTEDKLRSNVENHILPALGDVPLLKMDAALLTNWKAELSANGFSVGYCRRIFSSLNAILNYAVRLRFIPENPLKNVEKFRDMDFEVPEEKLHYYTPDQFLRFATAADQAVQTYYERSIYMFFMIAYYTGMRKGEIHALRWIDIEDNVIRVRHSISQKIKGKQTVETPPKNKASIRSLQIPEPLQDLLNQYRVLQMQHFGKKWNLNYRVVRGDQCVSDTALSNYNKAWAAAAELETIRIHDYRHSHASLLANEGINIQEIARRLGHSNVQITWETYSHLYPREEERAVQVLNRVSYHEFATKKL